MLTKSRENDLDHGPSIKYKWSLRAILIFDAPYNRIKSMTSSKQNVFISESTSEEEKSDKVQFTAGVAEQRTEEHNKQKCGRELLC